MLLILLFSFLLCWGFLCLFIICCCRLKIRPHGKMLSASQHLLRSAADKMFQFSHIFILGNLAFRHIGTVSYTHLLNTFGFTARIYAMVINVVIPARISVFTVVWFSRSLNTFSNIMLNPSCKLFFPRKKWAEMNHLCPAHCGIFFDPYTV